MSRLFESSLTAKISNMLVEEKNLKEGYCPRCGIAMQGYPATSRFDNKTEICSDCGTDEAMKNFTGETLEDPNKYDTKTGKELINAVEPNRNDIAGDSEENLKDIKEAALPKEPPVRGKNERVADFIIDYDVFEFRNVYDGDNDEERRTKLIQDIEKDPDAAKKYVQDIADEDDRPEWRDQAEQILKLFESATNKKEIEDRIGELRAKIDDDASEDEKKAMEKEIAELEGKLNESNAGTESITEIKLHLEDIKSIIDEEGSIDAGLLKSKIEELLKLIDEHKQIMNESVSLGDDLLQNAIDSLNELIMYADDGSLNRNDPDYSDFFKALDKAQETVEALNDAFNKKEESTLTEDSYDEDIFQTIENALYDAGLNVDRYTDVGMMTKNLGWCVSNSEGEVNLTCVGTYLDESGKLNKSKLKESYSEKLGGDPEDFISDVEEIKSKLNEINIDGFGSKLAYEIVEQFIDTCDSQIRMAKDKLNMNESVNVVTSDGSKVDTNDLAGVTSNDGNVTVVTSDGTTVSINSTPEEPAMDVPLEEPIEEPVVDAPVEEPIEEDAPVEELEDEEDEEETDNIEAKRLDMIKNQGNVYMLKITENDGKETYWVCEDYNQETNEGNNASQFDNKEDADDNYFHRVGLNVGEAVGDAE